MDFVKELGHLKDTTRTAWTQEGRRESVAEHSWRLALFSLALEEQSADVDWNKIIRMSLIHDLGEIDGGDVPAVAEVDQQDKLQKEESALLRVTRMIPERTRQTIVELWREYNEGETEEAKLVKALDKMETIMQHNQGRNPADFNYEFNLSYGNELAMRLPILNPIRESIDRETGDKIKQRQGFKEV